MQLRQAFQSPSRDLGGDAASCFRHEDKERDFVVVRNGNGKGLIQACWTLDDNNRERELPGVHSAARCTGRERCRIITFSQTEYNGLPVSVQSVCELL